MKTLVAKRHDIVFYLKIFLLKPNTESRKTATSVICNKSDTVLEAAYQKKTVPNQECPTKELDENMKFADQNSLNSAPAIILPDETLHFGFLNAAALEKRIDEAAGRVRSASEGRRIGGSAK